MQVLGPHRFNPDIPIPAEATAIHGITDADVATCPKFGDAAAVEYMHFMQDCDLHGFNARRFDVLLIRTEFKRVGILNFPPLETAVVDSFKLFCLQERRDLTAAVEFYCGRSHEGAAHSALADAKASLEVLQGQLRHYPALPRDVAGLAALCAGQDITADGKFQWRGEVPVVAFGRHAGVPLAVMIEQHQDYLRWMSLQVGVFHDMLDNIT
uniref:Exonuclease domain-containing protein n=1 Tax=Tetradesmus obliquus TaxID=3088 RepID=A0A383W7N1_TETOB|eukprot:jgi/Sobl393_1/732/SZX73657.1